MSREKEDDFFECAPGFEPDIGPEWDHDVVYKTSTEFDITAWASPALGIAPPCLSAEITIGEPGRIVFLHYRDMENDQYTELMLEEHARDALHAFFDSMLVPCWWKAKPPWDDCCCSIDWDHRCPVHGPQEDDDDE